jgi:Sulfotransferase family
MRSEMVAAARRLRRQIAQLLLRDAAVDRPVFIIGCGRSGTTVMGEMLSKHPALAYLFEPRDIWSYEPRTDIWSDRAEQLGGRVQLGAEDARPETTAKIAKAFGAELWLQRGTILVEKFPINSFRIAYIHAMFPDARFIFMVRHGLDVARSIAKLAPRGLWFGHKDYKWRLLSDLARKSGDARLVELCTSEEMRGLLEWRLSVLAARAALERLPRGRWIEIRYEDLVADPLAVCRQLEAFLGLPPSEAMRRFASVELGRRSHAASVGDLSPEAREIAGGLLAELGYLNFPQLARHT